MILHLTINQDVVSPVTAYVIQGSQVMIQFSHCATSPVEGLAL